MQVDTKNLIDVRGIADMAGISSQAVSNWRARYEDFPKYAVLTASGPLYLKDEILAWMKQRGRGS